MSFLLHTKAKSKDYICLNNLSKFQPELCKFQFAGLSPIDYNRFVFIKTNLLITFSSDYKTITKLLLSYF